LRSRRFGATAVGRVEATKGFHAATFVDQQSTAHAESQAITRCNQEASDCKVVARFSGPGKCVFVAGGTTVTREPGGVRRRTGVKTAGTEAEALQTCRSDFQECRVFHTRCNSLR
jgi:pyrimidine deaminase RibD-like protein